MSGISASKGSLLEIDDKENTCLSAAVPGQYVSLFLRSNFRLHCPLSSNTAALLAGDAYVGMETCDDGACALHAFLAAVALGTCTGKAGGQ